MTRPTRSDERGTTRGKREESVRDVGSTPRCHGGVRRRAVLAGVATVTAGGLAGCLGEDDAEPTVPDPVDLDGGRTCDVCGMVIADHYGPNAQAFYEGYPADRDGPAWYDSVTEMLSDRDAVASRVGDPIAAYVTDYSAVAYDVVSRDEDRYLSSHVAADAFVDVTEASFVIDSGVLGAMGADLIPFSDGDDAAAFVETHGGEVVSDEAVSPSLAAGE